MISVRKSSERGTANIGWLDSKHSFSFGNYHDPEFMGFGSLRVINEDWIEPGQGFGTHGHQDMEIVTYIIDGALEHKDNMQNGSVLRSGDVQRMTAGTGVRHSEFNHSQSEIVHLLQIWILPETQALDPGYEEKSFDRGDKTNRLRLIGSRDGRDGSLTIHQDMDLYATCLMAGARLVHTFEPDRQGWLQIVAGKISVDATSLSTGDGAAISELSRVNIKADSDAEVLLFDMAAAY